MYALHTAREKYLSHALDITDRERELIEDYSNWLPTNVIDAHAHSNRPEEVEYVTDATYHHMMSSFPSYTVAESRRVQALFHPSQIVRTLRFAHVFRGINHRIANQYLLDTSNESDRVALYGLPEDPPYTIDMLSHPRVAGLKMYYSYTEPVATKIYEVFKPEILAAAEMEDVPIILHTPKMIVDSAEDVLQLTKDFPNLRVAIAHLGSSKFDVPGLQDAYDMLVDTSVVWDTALNPSADVCLRALQTFGANRILFGSDEPLHLLRAVPFIHPAKGQRLATSYHYHWQPPDDFKNYNHLADGAVHSHWLALGAIRTAIDSLPTEKQEAAKQAVFHDNAATFYGFETS